MKWRLPPVWTLTTGLLVAALIADAVMPHVRGGTGRSLWFGVVAGLLLGACMLLGLRKRWLRLRLGPVAAWTRAHNALGVLALGLALLHSQWQRGGLLTSALLLVLCLVAATGLAGAILQATIPRRMAARIPHEVPGGEYGLRLVTSWQRVHAVVVAACGPQSAAAERLATAERRVSASPAAAAGLTLSSDVGASALASFYNEELAGYLEAPSVWHKALGTESRARLAFDALSEGLGPELRGVVATISENCHETRLCAEERQLRSLMLAWQLVHIPLAVVLMVLLVVHVVTVMYY